MTPKVFNKYAGSRLKTECQLRKTPEKGVRRVSPRTPTSAFNSRPMTPLNQTNLSSEAVNFSQASEQNTAWHFSSAKISLETMINAKNKGKLRHRPSFNLVEEKISTPRKKYQCLNP